MNGWTPSQDLKIFLFVMPVGIYGITLKLYVMWNIGVYFWFWWLIYKRIGFKMRYFIAPNTTGPGLQLFHTGDFIWIGKGCKVGSNCTLRPGVVFGRKCVKPDPDTIKVGNNCEFGVGSKIIGKVKIGDNVIVGANAVVTKDVPDNAVVVGIPAVVIKIRE